VLSRGGDAGESAGEHDGYRRSALCRPSPGTGGTVAPLHLTGLELQQGAGLSTRHECKGNKEGICLFHKPGRKMRTKEINTFPSSRKRDKT